MDDEAFDASIRSRLPVGLGQVDAESAFEQFSRVVRQRRRLRRARSAVAGLAAFAVVASLAWSLWPASESGTSRFSTSSPPESSQTTSGVRPGPSEIVATGFGPNLQWSLRVRSTANSACVALVTDALTDEACRGTDRGREPLVVRSTGAGAYAGLAPTGTDRVRLLAADGSFIANGAIYPETLAVGQPWIARELRSIGDARIEFVSASGVVLGVVPV